jgi:hypothetical protein
MTSSQLNAINYLQSNQWSIGGVETDRHGIVWVHAERNENNIWTRETVFLPLGKRGAIWKGKRYSRYNPGLGLETVRIDNSNYYLLTSPRSVVS